MRLSLRAALCLSAPLIVGLLVHQRYYAIVFAIGALWAISQDGLDEWRNRGPRLLGVALSAGAGVAVGAYGVATHHSLPVETSVLAGVALVAGVIEASHYAAQGAYLLVGATLGVGLQFTGRVWQAASAVVLGALWVYLVAALMDRRNRQANQRVSLAHAFDALAAMTDAVGTATFYDVRATTVTTLDAAQDVLGSRSLRSTGPEEVALRQCLVVALRWGEVISYLEGTGRRANVAIADSLRGVARSLATTTGCDAVARLIELPERVAPGDELATIVSSAVALPALSPRPPSTRIANRSRLPLIERLRFAAILALAVVTATLAARSLDAPHGFWLPLTVAIVLRPDLGPIMGRALARSAGTVVGVGIAALASWAGNSVLTLIGLSCVMAAVMPWATRRSHLLSVITFTPIVFAFVGLLGTDRYLFIPRIVDTAVGGAIVLTLDLVLWSTAPSLRPSQQLITARRAAQRYEREATLDDPIHRHLLRRQALRAISHARSAFALARAEPHALRRPGLATARELDDIEAAIDAHTAALLTRG